VRSAGIIRATVSRWLWVTMTTERTVKNPLLEWRQAGVAQLARAPLS
jgi:hypothetical protein